MYGFICEGGEELGGFCWVVQWRGVGKSCVLKLQSLVLHFTFRMAKRGSWPGPHRMITARWFHTISWTGKCAIWMSAFYHILHRKISSPYGFLWSQWHDMQIAVLISSRPSWPVPVLSRCFLLFFCTVAIAFGIVSVVFCTVFSEVFILSTSIRPGVKCWPSTLKLLRVEALQYSGVGIVVCEFDGWSRRVVYILPAKQSALPGKQITG